MGDNQNDRKKIEGHRASIREHIDKYNKYPHQQDKDGAWKTIQRVQKLIADLRKGLSNVEKKPEDSWTPPKNTHY